MLTNLKFAFKTGCFRDSDHWYLSVVICTVGEQAAEDVPADGFGGVRGGVVRPVPALPGGPALVHGEHDPGGGRGRSVGRHVASHARGPPQGHVRTGGRRGPG